MEKPSFNLHPGFNYFAVFLCAFGLFGTNIYESPEEQAWKQLQTILMRD
jgi:hypothetical protein